MIIILPFESNIIMGVFTNLFCMSIGQVIRENQVVVVVGETGSGKTTQLTQVTPCIAITFTFTCLKIFEIVPN